MDEEKVKQLIEKLLAINEKKLGDEDMIYQEYNLLWSFQQALQGDYSDLEDIIDKGY